VSELDCSPTCHPILAAVQATLSMCSSNMLKYCFSPLVFVTDRLRLFFFFFAAASSGTWPSVSSVRCKIVIEEEEVFSRQWFVSCAGVKAPKGSLARSGVDGGGEGDLSSASRPACDAPGRQLSLVLPAIDENWRPEPLPIEGVEDGTGESRRRDGGGDRYLSPVTRSTDVTSGAWGPPPRSVHSPPCEKSSRAQQGRTGPRGHRSRPEQHWLPAKSYEWWARAKRPRRRARFDPC
jgi:hypothetical protein